MRDLTGQTALVTGASRGIGAAIATTLARYGAHVVLAARSKDALDEHVQTIADAGGRAMGVSCDVSRNRDVEDAVGAAVEAFGRLDILVNNAGVIEPIAKLAETDPEAWSRGLDINVKGVYHGLRAALPIMAQQGRGVIVNISSGAANAPLEGWSQYCASKAAAKMLTQAAHKEYAASGVRVVGLSPGTVATDMMASIKQSGVNPVSQLDWSTHIPPKWVGEAAAFLCTEGGAPFAGTDFSLKTDEGRALVGLPPVNAPA